MSTPTTRTCSCLGERNRLTSSLESCRRYQPVRGSWMFVVGTAASARRSRADSGELESLVWTGSRSMLGRARRNLIAYQERIQVCEFDLPTAAWRGTLVGADVVVSSLALHHLCGSAKAQLFGDVWSGLAPGGSLVIADMIEPASELGRAFAGDSWEEDVRTASMSSRGDLSGLADFRDAEWNYFQLAEPDPIDTPSTLLSQLDWLREAGFSDVDVYWMRSGHAVFGGTRPSTC